MATTPLFAAAVREIWDAVYFYMNETAPREEFFLENKNKKWEGFFRDVSTQLRAQREWMWRFILFNSSGAGRSNYRFFLLPRRVRMPMEKRWRKSWLRDSNRDREKKKRSKATSRSVIVVSRIFLSSLRWKKKLLLTAGHDFIHSSFFFWGATRFLLLLRGWQVNARPYIKTPGWFRVYDCVLSISIITKVEIV